jgi:hypothetical protein
MTGVVKTAVKASIEGFVGAPSSEHRRDAYVDFAAMFTAFVVSVIILAFVGKYLWNNIVCDLVTIAKPARNVWQILGLMIFMALVLP